MAGCGFHLFPTSAPPRSRLPALWPLPHCHPALFFDPRLFTCPDCGPQTPPPSKRCMFSCLFLFVQDNFESKRKEYKTHFWTYLRPLRPLRPLQNKRQIGCTLDAESHRGVRQSRTSTHPTQTLQFCEDGALIKTFSRRSVSVAVHTDRQAHYLDGLAVGKPHGANKRRHILD